MVGKTVYRNGLFCGARRLIWNLVAFFPAFPLPVPATEPKGIAPASATYRSHRTTSTSKGLVQSVSRRTVVQVGAAGLRDLPICGSKGGVGLGQCPMVSSKGGGGGNCNQFLPLSPSTTTTTTAPDSCIDLQ